MKLSSGKRIGQSGGELATASVFSFTLHSIFLAAVLFYLHAAPKKYTPPFYEVKLVGQPAESLQVPQAPPSENQPATPKQAAKAAPKAKGKKEAPQARKATAIKSAVPALVKPQKPATPTPEETVSAQPPAQAGAPSNEAAGPGAKGEGVAVTTSQQDFKFGWYLTRVRDLIGQNWKPTPDAQGAKVRIIFTINRSGWTSPSDINIDEKNSTGTYQFKLAAVRAILSSKPFPSLPEDFPKQTLQLSVDLMAE
jgi:outer membrane biosynthesis protein TonB